MPYLVQTAETAEGEQVAVGAQNDSKIKEQILYMFSKQREVAEKLIRTAREFWHSEEDETDPEERREKEDEVMKKEMVWDISRYLV